MSFTMAALFTPRLRQWCDLCWSQLDPNLNGHCNKLQTFDHATAPSINAVENLRIS
jgi:hypothetical protein